MLHANDSRSLIDDRGDIRVLTGPTASGKSLLGVELAERLGAEIVSMDSMALYRGMDIGTAKPDAGLRRRVPHHLIDVLDPWESASVAWWLARARECVESIRQRGRRVLFVGGTGLYLRALLYGLFDGPPADVALRRRLEHEARTQGAEVLYARLAAVDPAAAARLHPNDVRRVVRALEVFARTGRPISAWQQQGPGPSPDGRSEAAAAGRQPAVLWLDLPRAELYARIDRRVEEMVRSGLAEEVRALGCLPRPLSREASQALGYAEMRAHLEGKIDLAEAVRRIQQRSRQFAKRQITWFRHLPGQPIQPELTFAAWGLTMGPGSGSFQVGDEWRPPQRRCP